MERINFQLIESKWQSIFEKKNYIDQKKIKNFTA